MSLNGTYKITMRTENYGQPFRRNGTMILKEMGPTLSGRMCPITMFLSHHFSGGWYEGNAFRFTVYFSTPCQQYAMDVEGTVEGNTVTGTVTAPIGTYELVGTRVSDETESNIA